MHGRRGPCFARPTSTPATPRSAPYAAAISPRSRSHTSRTAPTCRHGRSSRRAPNTTLSPPPPQVIRAVLVAAQDVGGLVGQRLGCLGRLDVTADPDCPAGPVGDPVGAAAVAPLDGEALGVDQTCHAVPQAGGGVPAQLGRDPDGLRRVENPGRCRRGIRHALFTGLERAELCSYAPPSTVRQSPSKPWNSPRLVVIAHGHARYRTPMTPSPGDPAEAGSKVTWPGRSPSFSPRQVWIRFATSAILSRWLRRSVVLVLRSSREATDGAVASR